MKYLNERNLAIYAFVAFFLALLDVMVFTPDTIDASEYDLFVKIMCGVMLVVIAYFCLKYMVLPIVVKIFKWFLL